jgi:hypothetical protein
MMSTRNHKTWDKKMKCTLENNGTQVVIKLPVIQAPEPSKSGKNLVLATTNGFKVAGFPLHGKVVKVAVNMVIPTR